MRYQIGWLSDAIEHEDDIGELITEDFGPDVSAMADYTAETIIRHSHGPVTRPIPVYIDWPPA